MWGPWGCWWGCWASCGWYPGMDARPWPDAGMKDCAMLIAMEMTLAREKRGCEWAGHMLACCCCCCCWGPGGVMVPGVCLGDPEDGESVVGKVGLLATRVRGECVCWGYWSPSSGCGEPGGAG